VLSNQINSLSIELRLPIGAIWTIWRWTLLVPTLCDTYTVRSEHWCKVDYYTMWGHFSHLWKYRHIHRREHMQDRRKNLRPWNQDLSNMITMKQNSELDVETYKWFWRCRAFKAVFRCPGESLVHWAAHLWLRVGLE
jgi:hypothetical protein